MISVIDISLEFGKVEGLKEIVAEARKSVKHSSSTIKQTLAAVKLLSLTAPQFILIRYSVAHGPDFAVYCKLINKNIIFGIEDLQFCHLLRYFPQEQVHKYFLFIQDELECDLTSFIEANLEDDDSSIVEESHKIVFYDDGERSDAWEAEFLEHHVSSTADDSGSIEISIVVAEDHFALGGLSDCRTHRSAHLCRHTVSLSLSSHLHYLYIK